MSEVGEQEYWLADTGQTNNPAINGALIKRQGLFQSVINTINIDDIEKTMADINKNGGQVLSPVMNIPNVGKIAYFKDPDGNTFGVIEDITK
jgi:predicted enzyme related to lactoylglutathione lyase